MRSLAWWHRVQDQARALHARHQGDLPEKESGALDEIDASYPLYLYPSEVYGVYGLPDYFDESEEGDRAVFPSTSIECGYCGSRRWASDLRCPQCGAAELRTEK